VEDAVSCVVDDVVVDVVVVEDTWLEGWRLDVVVVNAVWPSGIPCPHPVMSDINTRNAITTDEILPIYPFLTFYSPYLYLYAYT
jgi:hypothetical protein